LCHLPRVAGITHFRSLNILEKARHASTNSPLRVRSLLRPCFSLAYSFCFSLSLSLSLCSLSRCFAAPKRETVIGCIKSFRGMNRATSGSRAERHPSFVSLHCRTLHPSVFDQLADYRRTRLSQQCASARYDLPKEGNREMVPSSPQQKLIIDSLEEPLVPNAFLVPESLRSPERVFQRQIAAACAHRACVMYAARYWVSEEKSGSFLREYSPPSALSSLSSLGELIPAAI